MMYRSKQFLLQYKFLMLVSSFVLLLGFVFAACGTNVGAGNPVAGSPTSTTGCPNPTGGNTPPPAANVVLNSSNNNNTASANKGDTIEVDLSFGHHWAEAPATAVSQTQNLLTEQSPSGYALSSSHMCVWRFVATGTGTAQLNFVGQPICTKGEACPQY